MAPGRVPLERQMHRQLQEARTPQGVLDDAQAPLRREGSRTREIGEERNVIVGSVEIRVVEKIKRIEVEAQAETIVELERFADGRVEPYLKWRSEGVPSRVSI